MPMSINWDEHALKYLISPPSPSFALRDIILNVRTSMDINALAMMGRALLRALIISRTFNPPITQEFEDKINSKLDDVKLARVAQGCGLLERLKVHEVATDTGDVAHILCAYVGATLRCGWIRTAANNIEDSVNDICSMVIDDEGPVVIENNSHEVRVASLLGDDTALTSFFNKKMMKIPGIERMMTPIVAKPEPPPSFTAPIPTRGTRIMGMEMDTNSNESVSSGRSPPPHTYGPHYQQTFQPYYPPNPSHAPPPPPHPFQHIQSTMPQRFGSYAPGPVPTASPSFAQQAQPGPGVFPAGQSAYQQPQYPQTQFASPPPPQVNGMQSSAWGPQPNPPGYTMPAQAPGPVPVPAPMPPMPIQQSQGFISLFNELAMKHRMTTSWQQQKTGQQHIPEWTMWLLVDGTPRGHGTAATKQSAKEIAARAALQAMGWLAM